MSSGHKPMEPVAPELPEAPERTYETPRLVKLGTLRDLTHGGGDGDDQIDGGPAS